MSLEAIALMTQKPTVSLWKLLGGILLIVGTSIGGGMLALPAITAKAGFLPSAAFLFFTWLMMSIGAFLMLEVNLWCPKGSNIISMVRETLGKKAEILIWIVYLLLLYCLLSAYIAGGSDLMKGLFNYSGIHLSDAAALWMYVLVFAGIVCLGMRSVDLMNRFIMIAKVSAFIFIMALTMPLIKVEHLSNGHFRPLYSTMTAMITSFGFAIIVPSLRDYFDDDIKKLRTALLVGCVVPLICYVTWIAVIFGALPLTGNHGLLAVSAASQPITVLMDALVNLTNQSAVILAAKLFTSVCIITAFLGVSICLTDFLADGFKVKKVGLAAGLIYLATFIPPACLVLFFPQLFVFGISFAGVFCIILLIILPTWIALAGIKKHKKEIKLLSFLNHPAGLISVIVIAFVLLCWGIALNL